MINRAIGPSPAITDYRFTILAHCRLPITHRHYRLPMSLPLPTGDFKLPMPKTLRLRSGRDDLFRGRRFKGLEVVREHLRELFRLRVVRRLILPRAARLEDACGDVRA